MKNNSQQENELKSKQKTRKCISSIIKKYRKILPKPAASHAPVVITPLAPVVFSPPAHVVIAPPTAVVIAPPAPVVIAPSQPYSSNHHNDSVRNISMNRDIQTSLIQTSQKDINSGIVRKISELEELDLFYDWDYVNPKLDYNSPPSPSLFQHEESSNQSNNMNTRPPQY